MVQLVKKEELMQTIQIQVKDSYLEKFLNLLQALPQNEIRIVDKEFEDDKKMLQEVLDDYKSGKGEFTEIDKEFWDGMDNHIDNTHV